MKLALYSSYQIEESILMRTLVERVCQCGCGETFMARLVDIRRGWGRFKNKRHATTGPNNPNWSGGGTTKLYHTKLRSITKYPLRHKCRQAFEHAVRAGVLRRGCCEFCGNTKTEGHHEDYNQPYQVRWLCRKHHIMVDRWRRERETVCRQDS